MATISGRIHQRSVDELQHLAKRCLVLVNEEGMTMSDVARRFDVTPQTIKNWIERNKQYEEPGGSG